MDWLHYLFLLFPLIYFLLALYSFLEGKGNKRKGKDKDLLFKQGLFVLMCTAIAIVVDIFVLPSLLPVLPLPPIMVRVMSFLIIMYVIGLFVGGTELKSRSLNKKDTPTSKRKRKR